MDDRSELESSLDLVEHLIADAARMAAGLERAIGATAALGGDTTAADNALMVTYRALGLYCRSRARLMKMLAGYGGFD